MPSELGPGERIAAAIRLESSDRVPVVPTLLPEPAAGLAGLSMAAVGADNQTAVETVFRVFDAYGGWDDPYPAAYLPPQLQAMGTHPMKMRIPGRDLSDDDPFQMVEEEILQAADYDQICEMGFDEFYSRDFLWRISDLEPERLAGTLEALAAGFGRFDAECARRGVRPFFLASGLHPFFQLSLMRSLEAFTEDLYYDPEPVERALRRMTDDLIAKQLPIARASGVKLWLCTEERAGGYFYPPEVFERFWWPYTRRIVDAFWSEGIATLFHLDQCWDLNLPWFRKLPRGSAVLELDSATDIFAAKRLLGGHLCLHGDVSASLLSIGDPEAVAGYTRKLIDEVGRGGGFILGSGCSVPPNVKPENFRAMLETARTRPPARR